MISDNTLGSRPFAKPSCKASAVPDINTPNSMLLHIFATCPAPCSPARNTDFPMHSSNGRASSTSALSPPQIKVNVPALAPATPPETGASIKRTPCSVNPFASSRAASALMVLESITSAPLGIKELMPCSPKYKLNTCLSAGNIDTTTFAFATAAIAEGATSAPAADNTARASADKSNTVTEWPALTKLMAIGPPILPKPINVIARSEEHTSELQSRPQLV